MDVSNAGTTTKISGIAHFFHDHYINFPEPMVTSLNVWLCLQFTLIGQRKSSKYSRWRTSIYSCIYIGLFSDFPLFTLSHTPVLVSYHARCWPNYQELLELGSTLCGMFRRS